EPEAPEPRLGVRPLQPRHRLHALQDAPALVELELLLREVRRLHAVPEPDEARARLAPAEDRLEQRRLPGPVRTDESDVLATFEGERRARNERPRFDRDIERLRLDDRAPAP